MYTQTEHQMQLSDAFFSSTVIELNAQYSEIIGREEYIFAGFKNWSDVDISVDRMCHDQWIQMCIVGFLPPYAVDFSAFE